MESIIAYVEANLGTLIAGLLIGIILLYLEYHTKWFALFPNRNRNFDEVGPQYREHPKPNKILDEIRALPPAQRENAENSYIGLLVKWRVKLNHIKKETTDKNSPLLRVVFDDESHPFPLIVCLVDPKEYPEFNVLKAGHTLWLAGEIESMFLSQGIRLKPGTRFKID